MKAEKVGDRGKCAGRSKGEVLESRGEMLEGRGEVLDVMNCMAFPS